VTTPKGGVFFRKAGNWLICITENDNTLKVVVFPILYNYSEASDALLLEQIKS
jgi:hypothetical protein